MILAMLQGNSGANQWGIYTQKLLGLGKLMNDTGNAPGKLRC